MPAEFPSKYKGAISPSADLETFLQNHPERESTVAVVGRLNQAFAKGAFAYDDEVLKDLRKFPKPIVVDVEQTLLTVGKAVKINAFSAINTLRTIGNVIFVTNHSNRATIEQELTNNCLFRDDTVLINVDNYAIQPFNPYLFKATEIEKRKAKVEKAFIDYNEINPSIPQISLEYFFNKQKHLALLFLKRFNVPIIDDAPEVCINNFGMHSLRVDALIIEPNKETDFVYLNKGSISLEEAIRRTKNHYRSVDMEKNEFGWIEPPDFGPTHVYSAKELEPGRIFKLHRKASRDAEETVEEFWIDKPISSFEKKFSGVLYIKKRDDKTGRILWGSYRLSSIGLMPYADFDWHGDFIGKNVYRYHWEQLAWVEDLLKGKVL